jgi:crossover junction endodeoxyribonuclease RusA
MLSLTLPFPPSDNHYYGVVQGPGARRLYLTKAALDFRKAVKRALHRQLGGPPRLAGRLAVRVELHVPDLVDRDVANYLKALCDALTLAGLWLDDEQIDWLQVRRGRLIRGSGGLGGQCLVDVVETRPAVVQLALDEVAA